LDICSYPPVELPSAESALPGQLQTYTLNVKMKLEESFVTSRAMLPSIYLYSVYLVLIVYYGFLLPFRLHLTLGWVTILVYPTVLLILVAIIAIRHFIGNEMLHNSIVNMDYEAAMLTVIAQGCRNTNTIMRSVLVRDGDQVTPGEKVAEAARNECF